MKYLLLLLVFMFPEADKSGLLIKENLVFLSISQETTEAELMDYKETLLQEKGIIIDYEKLRFSKDDLLKYIKISVDCQDGFKGSFATPFRDKMLVGFYRIYNERVTTPFAVGTIPPIKDLEQD